MTTPDDVQPDDLTGYWAPDPPIRCMRPEPAARTTPDNPAASSDTADSPLRARIQALADEHPVAIPTNLIDEALDQPAGEPAATEPDTRYTQAIADVQSSGPAAGHNDGPSIAEAAGDDRTWDLRKAGE